MTQETQAPMSLPLPIPDLDSQEYWAGAKRRELLIQKCQDCGAYRMYPKPGCPNCASLDFEWVRSSGKGVVYSYSIVHHPTHPALVDKTPYNVVLVELEEGVRLISKVIDVPPQEIRVGMPVVVDFEDVAEDITLPVFRRAP